MSQPFPPDGYPEHDLCKIFELHDGGHMQELQDDIEKHGLRSDIIIWEGAVIDGRRRQRCCIALTKKGVYGREPRYCEFRGSYDAALALVVSLNLKRRHSSEAERVLAAARIAQIPQGGDRGNQHTGGKSASANMPPGLPGAVTRHEAAEMMGVTTAQVDRAKVVVAKGTRDLQAAVAEGKVSVTDASKLALETPEVQDAAVADMRSGAAATGQEGAKKHRPPADPKNGQVKFPWNRFYSDFGKIVRHVEAMAQAYGAAESPEKMGLLRELGGTVGFDGKCTGGFLHHLKKWYKKISKEEPPE